MLREDNALIEVKETVAPATRTASVNGTAVDLSKYRRASIIIHGGTITDGTHTPKLQTSATSGGTFADDDGVLDSFVAIAAGVTKVDIDLDGVDNRWGRVVVTVSGATSGGTYGVTIVGELKKI